MFVTICLQELKPTEFVGENLNPQLACCTGVVLQIIAIRFCLIIRTLARLQNFKIRVTQISGVCFSKKKFSFSH